jgi:amino acid transporter
MKNNKKIFFISLASILFLSVFFVGTNKVEAACNPGFHSVGKGCFADNTGLSENSVDYVLTTFMLWLLGIFGVIAVVAFVISGIQYLTSAGDEERAKNAKRNVKYALMGTVIALSSFIIVKAVDTVLRANTTNI